MAKKEELPQTSDEANSATNQNQITNNFNPSINVNPTINVTTPVNVKNEQPKERQHSNREPGNPLKRILIAVIIGVSVSVIGYFIKISFSKNGSSHQEELHQPAINATPTN